MSTAYRIRTILDAPPTHIPIPIDDARAIAAWRDGGGHLGYTNAPTDLQGPASCAIDRLVVSLPPEHPPWEPSEEQIAAYIKASVKIGVCANDAWARDALVAARAVFDREGVEG